MEEQAAPTLCRMGCGFFGSSATEGMCSQCFRDYQRRKQDQATAANSSTNQQLSSSSSPASSSSSGASGVKDEAKARDCTDSCLPTMNGGLQATSLSDLPASSQSTSNLENISRENSDTKSPKKNRCFICRKKVGLTGFHCRCGEQFCALHRYADKHNCSFDYKTSGREELQRKHPKVVAKKVQKL